ncbi:MAG: glycoside hydrolase family 65 protein [Clostridia bacterium]|nr:glycoside hydrolase family 65 protein [Clostridia bacterium]
MLSDWIIEKNRFDIEDIEKHGSKFLLGNGFMGYRGTMEEYSAEQLVAVNLAGFFDLAQNSNWRESVNAPNPLYTVLTVDGINLDLSTLNPVSHSQRLDIKCGIHNRKTQFSVNGVNITITAERFVSMTRENIIALKYTVITDKDITVTLKSGIDKNVWNISGNHLNYLDEITNGNFFKLNCETVQLKNKLEVYETVIGLDDCVNEDLLHKATINLKANEEFEFVKFGGIYHSDSLENSHNNFLDAVKVGYDEIKNEHISAWEQIWENSDVIIEGDDDAQLALRYSIYHLCSIAPHNTDKCGIPARGLSGQVYKGAAFWDTEMFMLPFFQFSDKKAARNLLKYRINTLEGAKRKAKEFGFEGAFFAWESQETGDDACTLFNVTDVFTNRPQRTYFKDKQIHVSADIVFAMWDYCRTTGDYSLLVDGGLDLMYECMWFFYTYSVFKPHKNRYEILDVVGPDEYHERVNNNAFTNVMVKSAVDIFIRAIDKVKNIYPEYFASFDKELNWVYDFSEKLYVPQPNEKGIIEQFDGYFTLEDTTPEILKTRELIKNEYWGGHGLASNTMVLKQADVIMMLNVFKSAYSTEIKKLNWDFYEPYTEHGSSLSACAYAIVAAEIGYTDWAYKYFMKTASVDLTGDTKQYLGSLYIGGTHPAANGGAWNTAIFGFAGVSVTDDTLDISPRIPKNWNSLSFKLNWKGEELNIKITDDKVLIDGIVNSSVTVYGKEY